MISDKAALIFPDATVKPTFAPISKAILGVSSFYGAGTFDRHHKTFLWFLEIFFELLDSIVLWKTANFTFFDFTFCLQQQFFFDHCHVKFIWFTVYYARKMTSTKTKRNLFKFPKKTICRETFRKHKVIVIFSPIEKS